MRSVRDPFFEDMQSVSMGLSRMVFGRSRIGFWFGMFLMYGFLTAMLLSLYVLVECVTCGIMGW